MISDEPFREPAPSTDPMPIRLGAPEEFARVRDFLRVVRFDEPSVAAALKIPSISRLREANFEAMERGTAPPALLTVIDLLVRGDAVAADHFRAVCGEATFAAFTALDLIREARQQAGAVFCPIWLYPVDGLLIASDRQASLKGEARPKTTDVVFPAHDSGTLQLLRRLPTTPGGDALDLCGGSGVGALHLARSGARAVTADITPRSVHFADFNARLNGLEIESVCGDLYAPVSGRQFDLVCAHPPWVPSTGDNMVFRDGGDTGEAIVERVVAGIPRHLRPGGTAILVTLGRDGRDATFQQRVRNWLGDAGRDCDVILGVETIISIDDMIGSIRRLHLNDDAEKAARLAGRFRELGTERFVHGAVFVRRTGEPLADPPLRLRMSADATAPDFERVFAWRQRRRRDGFAEWLMAARPRLSPHFEMNVRHIVRNGALTADSALLTAKRALSAVVQPDVWIAQLCTQLEGTLTVEQVFDAGRQANRIPEGFTPAAFLDFVGQMIERGVLDIDLPG